MSEKKVLTEDVAKQFLKQWREDEGTVDLSKFTAIEDDALVEVAYPHGTPLLDGVSLVNNAAYHLSKHEDDLDLGGLTELSCVAAESLSKHEGELRLSGLTSLSGAAAESLGKHEGFLTLDGLTSLSDAAAESLSKQKDGLSLIGLTKLSDAAAESLSKHEGEILKLNGLTSLSDSRGHVALAESLSKRRDDILELNDLTILSDAAAESLIKHEVNHLELNGLTTLSDAAAESLSKHKGFALRLNGLTTLSDAAAESLSKHKGEILELNGLTSLTGLSDTSQALLALKLDRLCAFTTLTKEQAKAIAASEMYLDLSGLQELAIDVAAELISHDGKTHRFDYDQGEYKVNYGVSLDGLTSLTTQLASTLAEYSGESISFMGVNEISDAAANAISDFPGHLHMQMNVDGTPILVVACHDSGKGFAALQYKIAKQITNLAVVSE